jgi:hypothetical protein
MNPPPYTPKDLAALREQILARCNDQELRTLCADLGVDYDDLPAMGRKNKARELVAFLYRQDRIPELEAVLARPRCVRRLFYGTIRNSFTTLRTIFSF